LQPLKQVCENNLILRYNPVMRVISNKALTDFSSIHALSGEPLQAWRKIIEARTFTNFSDLKITFNSIDKVQDYYVFNVGGNKYRIVSAIHFNQQKLFVRHVFTHKEYDKWKP
jgi:mRNA interferase HigB